MRWTRLWLLSFAVFVVPSIALGGLRELDLALGETDVIEIKSTGPLHVSRRGIVSLDWLGDDRWRLTGLKRGVVEVRSESHESHEAVLLIRVAGKFSGKGVSKGSGSLPALCGQPKIKCDDGGYTVKGVSDSWRWYRRAKAFCDSKPPCFFDVKLSRIAQKNLAADVQDYVDAEAKVRVNGEGQLVIDAPCFSAHEATILRRISRLWPKAVDRGLVLLRCVKEMQDFLVRARIFFLQEEDAASLGVHWGTNLVTGLEASRVSAFLADNQTRVVGEPVMRLSAGGRSEIQTGGEIRVLSQGNEPQEHWSPIGLSVASTIDVARGSMVEVTFEAKLRVPLESGDGPVSLQGSMLKTRVSVPLAQEILLGEVDMSSMLDRHGSVIGMRKVPIIGPIFRARDESEGQSKLYVLIQVNLATGLEGSGGLFEPMWETYQEGKKKVP